MGQLYRNKAACKKTYDKWTIKNAIQPIMTSLWPNIRKQVFDILGQNFPGIQYDLRRNASTLVFGKWRLLRLIHRVSSTFCGKMRKLRWKACSVCWLTEESCAAGNDSIFMWCRSCCDYVAYMFFSCSPCNNIPISTVYHFQLSSLILLSKNSEAVDHRLRSMTWMKHVCMQHFHFHVY